MELSTRAVGLLALGAIGWLILFIALAGGCDRKVTTTLASPPVTVTRTDTVVETSPVPTGAETPAVTAARDGDSASMAVLTAGGEVDPVVDVGRVFEFYLSSASETSLFVKYRPAGGAPCAATSDSDSGDEFIDAVDVVVGESSYRTADTWYNRGRFLFCMWLGTSSDDAASKVFSQTIAFRSPRGKIGFRAKPSYVVANRPVTLTFYGTSEAERTLLVKYRAAGGAGCAPTSSSDSGTELLARDINGGFASKSVWTPYTRGTYAFCAWIAKDSVDPNPVALRRFALRVH